MTEPSPRASKAEWRRWASQLPSPDATASRRAAEHLHRFLVVLRPETVLAYLALGDEVTLTESDRLAPSIALPRVEADGTMRLCLDDGRRERHGLGIDQPPADASGVDATALDAVVVPGRVFDRRGVRLGRGGGHYDRLLPHLTSGTPRVGITVDDRVVEALPTEPHDVAMTHLVTESGVVEL